MGSVPLLLNQLKRQKQQSYTNSNASHKPCRRLTKKRRITQNKPMTEQPKPIAPYPGALFAAYLSFAHVRWFVEWLLLGPSPAWGKMEHSVADVPIS